MTAYTTISSGTLYQDWPEDWGTSGTLGIFSTQNFTADDGRSFVAGTGSSLTGEFVTEASISVVASVGTYTAYTIPTTDTSVPNTPRYFAKIFDQWGTPRADLFDEPRFLRASLGSSITELQWANDCRQSPFRPQADTKPTTNEMNLAIAAAVSGSGAPKMTNTVFGIGKLSTAAIDAAIPIVVSDTDKRLAVTVVAGAQAGADAGAQINNARIAVQALSSNGGVIDARGLVNNLTITSTLTIPDNITVLLGAYRLTCSAGIILNGTASKLKGVGYSSELFFSNGAGIASGIEVQAGTNVEIEDLRVTGNPSTASISRGIYVQNSSKVYIRRVFQSGATFTPVSGPMCGIGAVNCNNIRIEDCEITGNGQSPVNFSSYDLLYNGQGSGASANFGIHYNRNRIYSSACNYSLQMFDVSYSEVVGNWIDQNNKASVAGIDLTTSGYGIVLYMTDGIVTAATNANPAVLTSNAHRLQTGDTVSITGATGSWTPINGSFAVTVITPDTFSIPVNSTAFGALTGTPNIKFPRTGVHNLVTGNLVQNSAGFGIYLASIDFSTVAHNQLFDVVKQQTGGVLPLGAISCNSGTADKSHLIVTGNDINTSGKSGIILANPKYSVVSNNTIKAVVDDGIQMNSGQDCTAAGNTIESPTGRGIRTIVPSTRIVISHNMIMGAGDAGMEIATPVDSNINGNTIKSCQKYGIVITGAALRTGVSGNRLNGNGISNVLFQELLLGGVNTTGMVCADNTLLTTTQTSGLDTSSCIDSDIHDNWISGYTNGIVDGGTRNLIHDNRLAGNTTPISGTATIRKGNIYSTGAVQGQATLGAGGTITVNTTEVRTGDNILLTVLNVNGGTLGILAIGTIVNATSFVINSTNAADRAIVYWQIVH